MYVSIACMHVYDEMLYVLPQLCCLGWKQSVSVYAYMRASFIFHLYCLYLLLCCFSVIAELCMSLVALFRLVILSKFS